MKYILASIACCIIFWGCDDPSHEVRDYPRVQTIKVEVTSTVVKVEGRLVTKGDTEIMDHGFTWSTVFPHISDSPKVGMGQLTTPGTFSADIHYNFEKGKAYNIRAYVRTSAYEVYGQNLTFTVK